MMRTLRLLPGLIFLFLMILASCTSTKLEDLEKDVDVDPCDTLPQPCDSVVDPCDTLVATFRGEVQGILQRYCTQPFNNGNGCHQANTPIGRDWTDYGLIKAQVDNGNFATRVLDNGGSNPMPPAYSTGPQSLTDCEKEVLQRWLDAGGPEN